MPNHVTNKLLIRGPLTRVEALLKQGRVTVHLAAHEIAGRVLSPASTEEAEFSLRGFVPPPEHPDYNTGGCSHRHPPSDLPPEMLARLGISADTVDEHPNCWYIWNRKNWGTKWDCYDVNIKTVPDTVLENLANLDGEPQGSAAIYFDTAWSPPLPVLDKIIELYPDLDIDFTFMDEDITGGGGGRVIVRKGKIVEEQDGINDPEKPHFFEIAGDLKHYTRETHEERLAEIAADEEAE